MSTKKLSVGGQAVIEGVMMRGPHKVAVAVRQPDGEIAVDVNPVNSIRDKYPILKKPLLRGVIALFESLYDGIKALAYSAQVSGEEDEQLTGKEMAMTIATSVLLAVGLFIVIPTWSMRFLHELTEDPMMLNGYFPGLYCGYFLDGGYSARIPVSRCGAQNYLYL